MKSLLLTIIGCILFLKISTVTLNETNVDSLTEKEKEGYIFRPQFPSAHFLACEGLNCAHISGLSLKNVTVTCDNPYIPIEFRFKNKLGRWEKDEGHLSEQGYVFLKTKPTISNYMCPPLRK